MRNALVAISVNTIASILAALVLQWITPPASNVAERSIASSISLPEGAPRVFEHPSSKGLAVSNQALAQNGLVHQR